jgi:hypothetical protein
MEGANSTGKSAKKHAGQLQFESNLKLILWNCKICQAFKGVGLELDLFLEGYKPASSLPPLIAMGGRL